MIIKLIGMTAIAGSGLLAIYDHSIPGETLIGLCLVMVATLMAFDEFKED